VSRRMITLLEDRRLLFGEGHSEDELYCVRSAIQTRGFLTGELSDVRPATLWQRVFEPCGLPMRPDGTPRVSATRVHHLPHARVALVRLHEPVPPLGARPVNYLVAKVGRRDRTPPVPQVGGTRGRLGCRNSQSNWRGGLSGPTGAPPSLPPPPPAVLEGSLHDGSSSTRVT
jgi:hypothetical protein